MLELHDAFCNQPAGSIQLEKWTSLWEYNDRYKFKYIHMYIDAKKK